MGESGLHVAQGIPILAVIFWSEDSKHWHNPKLDVAEAFNTRQVSHDCDQPTRPPSSPKLPSKSSALARAESQEMSKRQRQRHLTKHFPISELHNPNFILFRNVDQGV